MQDGNLHSHSTRLVSLSFVFHQYKKEKVSVVDTFTCKKSIFDPLLGKKKQKKKTFSPYLAAQLWKA